MSFTLALVGRPNVGKSTLFNRLVGKKLALVDDQPGVTRDRREGAARLGDMAFQVFDTAGLEVSDDDSLEARMRRQTERAVADADVCLFMIDARVGVTEADRHFAQLLRKSPTPVVLAANKSEGRAGRDGLMEAYELGLGDPLPISAEHGEGMGDLYDALHPFYTEPEEGDDAEKNTPDEDRPLHLAVVGRPNVGKSTLINALLGEDRMLTGPEAGVTRDSISVPFVFEGKPVRLVDTAGVRRRARVDEKLEKLSVADTLRAIQYAEVCVLAVDATLGLEKQDLNLAALIAEEGRALVVALNKWDAVVDRDAALRQAKDRLLASLPQMRGVPVVAVSGLSSRHLDKLMLTAYEARRKWAFRVSTAKVNRWLESALDAHPPPLVSGRRIKIRYATQIKSRPPTFALFTAKADDLPDHYVRYLLNSIRDTFDLDGPPIRVLLRQTRNPYADKE